MEFNASHAYLFEKHQGPNDEILSSMSYEWTSPGFISDLGDPEFQDLPPESMGFERMYETLDRGEPLIGSTSFFNETEWEYMKQINVKALLEMRVVVDGFHWGTIGFDDVINEREWTVMEVDVIRVAANVLGAAIKRQMDEAAQLDKGLVRKFFDLGLMGIEIPEQYGGQGGSFFQCILAIEKQDSKFLACVTRHRGGAVIEHRLPRAERWLSQHVRS